MEIYLIRHGKTPGNLERRYVGRTDEPLLESELRQIRPAEIQAPDLVFSSPLKRCIQTAEALFPGRNIRKEEKLLETDFGDFEYKNYEELNGHPAYQKWIDSGGLAPFPNGEDGAHFRKRCLEGFYSCLDQAALYFAGWKKKELGPECVAIVCHGGTIMAVCSGLLEKPESYYCWQVKNLEGYHLTISSGSLQGDPEKISFRCSGRAFPEA